MREGKDWGVIVWSSRMTFRFDLSPQILFSPEALSVYLVEVLHPLFRSHVGDFEFTES